MRGIEQTKRGSATFRRRPVLRLYAACVLLGALGVMPAPSLTAQAQANATSRRFIVYFSHGDAGLTAEARSLLRQAADYQRDASGRVTVVGHTDRIGSRMYNLLLSRRRARAVSAALIEIGVPASAIASRWSGETLPPHPTRDGVREPLNRAATVLVSRGPTSARAGDARQTLEQ